VKRKLKAVGMDGICKIWKKSIKMDIKKAPGATGDYHTNLTSKARTLVEHLGSKDSTYRFGFLHVKAVDDAGHDKNVNLKVKFLEEIDGMVLEIINLLEPLSENQSFMIVITGDHSTPVLYGDHSCEPVPFLICSLNRFYKKKSLENKKNIKKRKLSMEESSLITEWEKLHELDHVKEFNEISCVSGVLGRFPGQEILPLIKRFRNFID